MSRIWRKFNYSEDQNGILRRYLREGENWFSHLNNTKGFIIDLIEKTNPKNLAILGSGWLLDIPVEFILEQGIEVDMFDIVQPIQISHKFRKNSNIRFITADIGGNIPEVVYELSKHQEINESLIASKSIIGWQPDYHYDLVVSVNLLNQLDILAIDYLKQKTTVSDEHIIQLRKSIQQSHIDSLSLHRSAIITDYTEQVFSMNGELESEKNLIYCQMPHVQNKKEWMWDFDSQGFYYSGKSVRMKVFAFELAAGSSD